MRNKKILIFSVIIGIALAIFSLGIKETIPVAEQKRLSAYNHNASNLLDNVYKTNNTVILPIIYQNSAEEPITRQKVMEDIQEKGTTISSMPSNLQSPVTTGDKFVTKIDAKETVTYNVVVFGDVNKDGSINVLDIRAMILYCLYEEEYPLTDLSIVAANIYNEDNLINVLDIRRLILFCLDEEKDLVLNDPLSDKEKDSVPPVITVNPGTTTVYLGTKYTDAGATAKDAVDGTVTVTADTSKVNVNKVGTYTVTYKATDKAGNVATATRTVIVKEDTVKSISVKTNPTKTEYKYNEALDLSGGVLNVTWESKKTTTVSMTDSEVTREGYSPTKVGTQTITVKYNEKTTTFTIKVVAIKTGIIVTAPDNMTSKYGEDLDLSNVTFKYTLEQQETSEAQPVTTNMISGFDKNSLTNQKVKVTVDGFTDEFNVAVVDYISSIKIADDSAHRTEFKYGEEFSSDGLKVVAKYAGPTTSKEIPVGDLKINSDAYNATPELSGLGVNQTISITYGDCEPITYNVIVVDYISSIEIADDSTHRTEFKYGETFDKTGLKVVAKYAGPTTSKEIPVGDLTIDFTAYNATPELSGLGVNQTISITYDNYEPITYNVIVVDYISSIEISDDSAHRTEFKYGEEFSSNGLKVVAKYAGPTSDDDIDVADLTIDSTAYNRTDLDKNQTISITYGDCEPITYDVTVVNYISSIRIEEASTHRTEFILGETFDKTGLIVYGKYEGPADPVNINVEDLSFSGNDLSTIGEKTVTVTYYNSYKEPLTAEYTITVVKELANLKVTPNAQPIIGYRYEPIVVGTVAAGEDEKAITADDVTYTVTRDGTDASSLVTIEKEEAEDGIVTLTLTAEEVGKYIITPSANNVTATTAFTVEVDKNPEVNKITISDATTGVIRANKYNRFKITFSHVYEGKGTEDILDVPASKVSVSGLDEGTYDLMTGVNANEVIETTSAYVTGIEIIPTTKGSLTFSVGITDTDKNSQKTIEVQDALKYSVVLDGTPTEITLHHTDPNVDDDLIVSTDTGNIYTLNKAILQDQDANTREITVEDLSKNILEVKDNKSVLYSNISVKGFVYDEDSKNYVIPSKGTIEYIGISIASGVLENKGEAVLNGATITMTYDGNTEEATTLDVIVPARELQNIVVTLADESSAFRKERYETFEIATITSGNNGPELTSSDLNIKVEKMIDANNFETIYDTADDTITPSDDIEISSLPLQDSKLEFMSKQQGDYRITLTPANGDVKINESDSLTIYAYIDESEIINSITLSAAEDGTNLTESADGTMELTMEKDIAVQLNIVCKHNYIVDEELVAEENIDVYMASITITSDMEEEVLLLDSNGDEVDASTPVRQIDIYSETAGSYVITIQITNSDNTVVTKTINVTVTE